MAEFIDFIKEIELVKVQLRTAWLSNGQSESVAEHTWRMNLMEMCLSRYEGDIDISKVPKMSIIHDLGEAHEGDIPATQTENRINKLKCEELCLNKMLVRLPKLLKEEIIELWNEYNLGEIACKRFILFKGCYLNVKDKSNSLQIKQ